MTTLLLVLIALTFITVLGIFATKWFQKRFYKSYHDCLQKGNYDEAFLRGRSYYLSLNKKTRESMGITDIVQIDLKIKADIFNSQLETS